MIDCMNWLGLGENYSSFHNTRNWLAAVDELVVQKQAKLGICHIIFDNLDIHIRKTHHLTLPILMFEKFPTFHLSNCDGKDMLSTLELFRPDILDLNSEENRVEREHFLSVVHTIKF